MEAPLASHAKLYVMEAPAKAQQVVNKGKDTTSDLWWFCWQRMDMVRSDKWNLLYACILVDLIGIISYLILLLGEVIDLWWAPICGFFLQYMFGSMLMTSFGVIEEILPLTDLVPTATICWCLVHVEKLA